MEVVHQHMPFWGYNLTFGQQFDSWANQQGHYDFGYAGPNCTLNIIIKYILYHIHRIIKYLFIIY